MHACCIHNTGSTYLPIYADTHAVKVRMRLSSLRRFRVVSACRRLVPARGGVRGGGRTDRWEIRLSGLGAAC